MADITPTANGTPAAEAPAPANRIPADAPPAKPGKGKRKASDVDELLAELDETRKLAKKRTSTFVKVISGRTHKYAVAGAAGPGEHDAETWEEVDAAGGTETYETSRPGFKPGKTVDKHDGTSFVMLMEITAKLPVG
jgi:hypothetical protein